MSRYTLTLEKAIEHLKLIGEARRKWGKHASPPLIQAQIFEAIELVDAAGMLDATLAPKAEAQAAEIVKLRRQLGAAASREKGLRKQLGHNVEESEE